MPWQALGKPWQAVLRQAALDIVDGALGSWIELEECVLTEAAVYQRGFASVGGTKNTVKHHLYTH